MITRWFLEIPLFIKSIWGRGQTNLNIQHDRERNPRNRWKNQYMSHFRIYYRLKSYAEWILSPHVLIHDLLDSGLNFKVNTQSVKVFKENVLKLEGN